MKQLHLTLLAILLSLASFAQIAAITGPTTICGTATLTDATAGGTYSSSNTSIAAVSVAAGVVTGYAAGVCTITYTLSTGGYVTTTITVNPLPSQYIVSVPAPGLSSYCAGSPSTAAIQLNGSQAGVNYQLYLNGTTAVDTELHGTGSSLSWGVQSTPGSYSVIATDMASVCSQNMLSGASATVSVLPVPTVFHITGGGSYCAGEAGVDIGLDGSSTGVAYTLINAGSGAPVDVESVSGTGAALDFGFWPPGAYSVVAENAATLCSANMSGTATVAVTPLPTAYNVTGGGAYCIGSAGVHFGLDGSDPDVNYMAYDDGTPVFSTIAGTGAALDFGLMSAGAIFVTGTSAVTGCSTNMIGSAIITATSGTCSGMPLAGIAVASASQVCNGNPVTISLSGTVSCGTTFQWQYATDTITWTNITGAGSNAYSCSPIQSRYYRCAVTCTSSGLTANSVPVYVRVSNGIEVQYASYVPDTICNGLDFYVSTCSVSPDYKVVTWYGDETSDTTALTATSPCHANIAHSYSQSGTYSVKQLLYNDTALVDSASFSYEYAYCNYLPVRLFFDVNNNCVFDSSDFYMTQPVLVEINSAGIALDTITATSGFYYKANGSPGTVYGFKVIPGSGGVQATCPASGILYDTIQAFVNDYHPKYIALGCYATAPPNLLESIWTIAGRHHFQGNINVSNSSCTPESATVIMHFSPRYNFTSATPAPASVVGNTVTWNLGSLSAISLPLNISYSLDVSDYSDYSTWVPAGDTVQSSFVILPFVGDGDTSNNVITKVDTVTASYDPNEMAVAPQGPVLPCTPLQYTIGFENTGNGPAQNIYVMDTLPDNVGPKTLKIVAASAQMNIVMLNDGAHNIVKFDFPNIGLLDSSHYGHCDGMVVFTVNANSGLADGTMILNHAGIFFDDNPVVLTNTVQSIIGISPLTGVAAVCTGAQDTLWDASAGGSWSRINANAAIAGMKQGCIVTGVAAGTDTVIYTVTNSCASRSAIKRMVVEPMPSTITGTSNICNGATTTWSDSGPGGTWRNNNASIASIAPGTGMVTGIAAGMDTINYVLPTGCLTSRTVTVNPLPATFTVGGGGSYCAGDTGVHIIISGSEAGNHYQLQYGGAAVGAAVTGSGSPLDLGLHTSAGSYTVVATDPATTCVNSMPGSAVISIDPLPADFTMSGGGGYCAGGSGVSIGLGGSETGVNYQLFNGAALDSSFPGTGAALDFGIHTIAGSYTVIATNTTTTCTGNMPSTAVISINPLPVIFTVTGGGSYCAGAAGVHVSLGGSGTGINYQLFSGGAPVGSAVHGTGAILDFGLLTGAGSYGIVASDPATTCTDTMTGAAIITINPLPSAYPVAGGGSYCAGDTGVHIALAWSVTGVSYQLYGGVAATGSPTTGTGAALDFGLITTAGTYTIAATDTTTLCTANMAGSATVNVIPTITPSVAISSSAGDTTCAGTIVNFSALPVNGGATPGYTWKVNGILAGTASSYSYLPVNGDIITATLTSSAICPLPDTAIASFTETVLSPYVPAVTITGRPGPMLAPGQADTLIASVTGCDAPAFQWVINSTPVPGATSATFTRSLLYNNDSLSCVVNCGGECGQPGFGSMIITLSSVGVKGSLQQGQEVAIYPNPNNGTFIIKGAFGTLNDDEVAIEITNILGQSVYSQKTTTDNGSINEQVQLGRSLARGLYLLNLHSATENKILRLVLE